MEQMREKAKLIAKKNHYSIMLALLYIGLYTSFRDLFAQMTGVIGVIIFILGIAIEHGKVTIGLKLLDDRPFLPQHEAKVGIRSFRTLFTTYLWINLITIVLFIVAFLISFIVARPYIVSMLASVEAELDYGIHLSLQQMAGGVLLITSACMLLSELIYNTFFFSAPYLAETHQIYGFAAMRKALRLGKGHYKQILKMFSHYYVYMICFMCIEVLITQFLTASILASLINIFFTIVSIYVYEGEFVVAKALLFKSLCKEGESNDFINV